MWNEAEEHELVTSDAHAFDHEREFDELVEVPKDGGQRGARDDDLGGDEGGADSLHPHRTVAKLPLVLGHVIGEHRTADLVRDLLEARAHLDSALWPDGHEHEAVGDLRRRVEGVDGVSVVSLRRQLLAQFDGGRVDEAERPQGQRLVGHCLHGSLELLGAFEGRCQDLDLLERLYPEGDLGDDPGHAFRVGDEVEVLAHDVLDGPVRSDHARPDHVVAEPTELIAAEPRTPLSQPAGNGRGRGTGRVEPQGEAVLRECWFQVRPQHPCFHRGGHGLRVDRHDPLEPAHVDDQCVLFGDGSAVAGGAGPACDDMHARGLRQHDDREQVFLGCRVVPRRRRPQRA